MRALNHPGRFVLTCRSDRYHALKATPADTTVVVTAGLSPDQVVDWLRHRFADPSQELGVQRRWRPVITRLRRHPTGALARTLSSPLRLYLAVTMYEPADTEPKTLVELRATKIDEHLLSGLVPAIVRQHPYRNGDYLDAEKVTHWLREMAVRMSRNGTVDLRLDTLWPDSIRRVGIRRIALCVMAAVMALLFAAYFGIKLINDWRSDSAERQSIIGAAVIAVVLVGIACYRPVRHGLLYRRLNRRRIAWTDHKIALLIAGFAGFARYDENGLLDGVVFAAAIFGLFTLHSWSSTNVRVVDPRIIVRDGIIHDVVVITAFAVLLPLSSIISSLANGMPLHIALLAHAPGYLAGVALGLTFRTRSPWPSYLVAIALQAYRNECPYHFATFLAWTGRAGLTRMSGMAVQFRHREIQNWLTRDL